jgi:hypothetical protein
VAGRPRPDERLAASQPLTASSHLVSLGGPLTLDLSPESKLSPMQAVQKSLRQEFGIGELARRAGVGIDTVRYYERSGLVEPYSRLPSGYRRYRELDVARLRFIRRAQARGFTLAEIK